MYKKIMYQENGVERQGACGYFSNWNDVMSTVGMIEMNEGCVVTDILEWRDENERD